jgi:hypothetical protein
LTGTVTAVPDELDSGQGAVVVVVVELVVVVGATVVVVDRPDEWPAASFEDDGPLAQAASPTAAHTAALQANTLRLASMRRSPIIGAQPRHEA